ncbi:envelope stress response membrane protein PspB [Sandaracinobacteroides hominis]|uniref:envelope stress response membrane protein PspB n=1 Tax=Sandaracinobacteroides hominis TaxID=2780086 RepID=UPI0018F33FFE|nr:envelope stress response membrane protein PspB [Sandaracinobacteroides hominis]
MEDVAGYFVAATIVGMLFIGLPWLILHYTTKWKQAKTLTIQDENLLDELHDIARSLDSRMHTIERIIAADRSEPGRPAERYPEPRFIENAPEYGNVELHPQARRLDPSR